MRIFTQHLANACDVQCRARLENQVTDALSCLAVNYSTEDPDSDFDIVARGGLLNSSITLKHSRKNSLLPDQLLAKIRKHVQRWLSSGSIPTCCRLSNTATSCLKLKAAFFIVKPNDTSCFTQGPTDFHGK